MTKKTRFDFQSFCDGWNIKFKTKYNNFRELIIEEQKSKTRLEIAKILGICSNVLCNWSVANKIMPIRKEREMKDDKHIEMLKKIADIFNIEYNVLLGKSHYKKYSKYRNAAWVYLINEYNYYQIANIFKRDFSTIYNGVQKADEKLYAKLLRRM